MKKEFHDEEFGEATQVKLDIFRQYIREWFPVFKMKKDHDGNPLFKQVNFYDFFAGPGMDSKGTHGSPLIIQEEVKAFCASRSGDQSGIPVKMLFNDIDPQYIQTLKLRVDQLRCSEHCCRMEYSSLPFQEMYTAHLSEMRTGGHANLILLDQFGIKEVTPEIIRVLLDCGQTDILFFISSSFIHRFVKTPEFQRLYDIDPEHLEDVEYNVIHRFVCDYFRGKLNGSDALIAPFSIKKGSNVYGVIFASKNLLGLEKFLSVCWGLDNFTGEANYNIDKEIGYSGDMLFPEMNKPTKVSLFENATIEFIRKNGPNNKELYCFCLEQGFPASKANSALKLLQKNKTIRVLMAESGEPARKGAFYLKDLNVKVIYRGIE